MSEPIKIEKGIPVPSGRTLLVDALRSMSIGDSFVLSRKTNVHSSARQIGIKVSFRRISETENRVWRVK